jgi:site-specific DNA-methyltransferase (adenine-specific)
MSTTGEIVGHSHVPDVLETIAQLPNDDVYTRPIVVQAMLDTLPDHVWSEPSYTWLDPGTKSGIFLREVYRRLMWGLVDWEPDGMKRRQHILRNMLHGAATTQINGDIARRSLYQTKNATGMDVEEDALRKLIVRFETSDGNIPYIETQHVFSGASANRSCRYCGAPEALARENREVFAYSFLHETYPTKELTNMKFDVIVGNPPYQIGVEGNTRTKPIYQLFVERAIAMSPRYVVMITPSRWFTGGLGLDDFRDKMINDRRLSKIVDNPKLFDCFPGVEIKGGVSYFLWDRDYSGDCEFSTRIDGNVTSTATRDLRDGHGVVIRDNRASALVQKILDQADGSVETWFYPRLAFSQTWRTNFRGESDQPFADSIPLIHNNGIGYVSPAGFERNLDLVDKWKVLLPKAGDGHGREISFVIGDPIAIAPGSACTESYFVAGAFDSAEECRNYALFLCTKFVRFLVLQRKATQDVTADRFRFVPTMPMSTEWTDELLYEHFGLAPEDVEYIERTIHPRTPTLSLDSPIPITHLPGGSKHRSDETTSEPVDGDE